MVSSLDGYIASKDGSLSWLESSDSYEAGSIEESAEDFIKTIGCFVMGSRTYELARTLGWPYGDLPVIVLTHRSLPADRDTVKFYSGDPKQLVDDCLKPECQNIWVVGGSMLVKECHPPAAGG